MLHSVLVKDIAIWDILTHTLSHGDILVEDGVIQSIRPEIPDRDVSVRIDGRGCFATTGWIDAHAHLYYDNGCIGINPQLYQVPNGVTYGLDQGTTGADNYEQYREYVLYSTDMKIKSFLNIAKVGIPLGTYELLDFEHNLDKQKFIETYRKYPNEMIGVKLRITGKMCIANARKALEVARQLGDALEIPISLHVTNCVMPMEEILNLLRTGDTFTHTYAKTTPGILGEDGHVRRCVCQARERGIYFDVGHGVTSLSFEVLEKALADGFYPDTIGTDLHMGSLKTPVIDLPTTVAKFLYYGMKLEDVLDAVTVNAYRQYKLTDKTMKISPGEEADFVIWKKETGEFRCCDCEGTCINVREWLAPQYTVLGCKVFTPRKS